jgi:hypothetical protein
MPISRKAALSLTAAAIAFPARVALGAAPTYDVAFAAGSRDAAGNFMGGTELRSLVAHAGKLYAGNGYWMDRPGSEGTQAAQVLVLDGVRGRWRVDRTFDDGKTAGHSRDLAVSTMCEITFATDNTGAALPAGVSMLVASTWNLAGFSRVWSRVDGSGTWAGATLAQDRPEPKFLPQIRSFGTHRDRVTGIDGVFAGQAPRGIFHGSYDPTVAGRIRWSAAPELDMAALGVQDTTAGNLKPRVGSFAECNGRLYATIGQQIVERTDGPNPTWRIAYTNSRPGKSETGLRGLTAIPSPSGSGEVLLAAVEGDASRILRVDPTNGSEFTELDVIRMLSDAWGIRAGYAIVAYNDMTKTHDSQGRSVLLMGLEAFVAAGSPLPAGHGAVDVGYGRLDGGGWYLMRSPDGRYHLQRIVTGSPERDSSLVSTRSISPSPFKDDADATYFAGYDANYAPVHNTAWIVRGGMPSG